MDRRAFLAGAAASLPLALPQKAEAAGQCGWITPDTQACTVGLLSDVVDQIADRQQASQWCWAASIAMVFAYYGHPLAQQTIVQQTWGSIQNLPGYPGQILAGLNRNWIDENGDPFSAQGDVMSANVMTAVQDLSNDEPLLIGTMGHCMVLTALSYVQNIYGQWQIQSAVVRDPWPYSPGQRYLTPQEWGSANFLARIRVS